MSEKNNKQLAACEYIASNYIEHHRLRMDIVSQKVQIRHDQWRDISNSDINDIVCQASAETGVNIGAREVLAVLQSHLIPHVHPMREYLQSLPTYNPASGDWIDDLARQVEVVNSDEKTSPKEVNRLWHVAFKKWFVAMVAGWMSDEVVNQQVLVLIGKQGIYKTTWLERLMPPELRAYSCKMASSRELSRDDRMRIAEFGLIALDEIDAMTPRELNVMKSVITATDVNERAAYAYTKDRRIRLASFCASGNRREFLTDLTGNRRWLPFEVKAIQNPFVTTLPYTLLYAQAKYLIEHDFNYWFDQNDINGMEDHMEDFREQNNEEQLLMVYFSVPAVESPNSKYVATFEIRECLIINPKRQRIAHLNAFR